MGARARAGEEGAQGVSGKVVDAECGENGIVFEVCEAMDNMTHVAMIVAVLQKASAVCMCKVSTGLSEHGTTEGQLLPFNLSSFLVEELVIDETSIDERPVDYRVYVAGGTVLFVLLTFSMDFYDDAAG